MQRTIETKFYHFGAVRHLTRSDKQKSAENLQNDSGGYWVDDEQAGVGAHIIIEAVDWEEADRKLEKIGSNVSRFNSPCPCCGERWGSARYSAATAKPKIHGTTVEQYQSYSDDETAYVHYYDGTIKKFVIPRKQWEHELRRY